MFSVLSIYCVLAFIAEDTVYCAEEK